MPATRKIRARHNRTAKKGGFLSSEDIWSFAMCKIIIDNVSRNPPAGVKKSWREALAYLASLAGFTPEHLYNKITPDEFFAKIGKPLAKNPYGDYAISHFMKYRSMWAYAKDQRTRGVGLNRPLPGKAAKELTPEQLAAKEAAREEKEMKAFFKEESYLRNNAPREYDQRVQELEDGATLVASEECYGHSAADPGLCLAAHKGTAKRIARREEELKARARRQALNAVAQNAWANAQGPLLAMAAQHANKPNNFKAVYNGVEREKVPLKKGQQPPPKYVQGTGTWLTGRNVPKAWPPTAQEKAWEPKYGPNYHKQLRGPNWEAPPQQEGDWINGQAIGEILAQVYPEFPVSGPNKKLPEKTLYDQIKVALKGVRYEKGYEGPVNHQPKLDVYDQALSRAKNWRRKGAVNAQ